MTLSVSHRQLVRRSLRGSMTAALLFWAAGCGYMVGPPYSGEVRSVHVPIFENLTPRRNLEYQLTEAVQKQIQLKTGYVLAKESESLTADTRLTGKIVAANKAVLGETGYDDARELQFSLVVELTWEDLRTRKILLQQRYPIPLDVIQQRSQSEFAVELGQSRATAEHEAIQRMARQIVELMEEPIL